MSLPYRFSLGALLAAWALALPLSAATVTPGPSQASGALTPAVVPAAAVIRPQPTSLPQGGFLMPSGGLSTPSGGLSVPTGRLSEPTGLPTAALPTQTPVPRVGAATAPNRSARAHSRRLARKNASDLRAQLKAGADGTGITLSASDRAVLEGRLKAQEALGSKSSQ
jgi:hypothetical protein